MPLGMVLILRCSPPRQYLCVLCQRSAHFLLLFKPPGVRHLDMAPFVGQRFIHDPLQSGVQLGVVHPLLRVKCSSPCAVSMLGCGVGNQCRRDFILDLGLGFLPPEESQLPPTWRRLCHDG